MTDTRQTAYRLLDQLDYENDENKRADLRVADAHPELREEIRNAGIPA